ncbi:TPA: hypothetical protein NHR53_005605 [Pseudomonas aeruginosa]|nr:hypothetical protein [Pseudomonas aeruginosa]HCE8129019.1 hypothetical protein [Pseudomonas aeruginosa]HCF0446806.1 hypothetical protein [Pseudomonas aeruginosa]
MKHETTIDLSIPQSISTDVLLEKYAKDGETTQEEIFARVAKALASIEKDPAHWEEAFLYALRGGFIPAGRIMSAAGTGIRSTLMNCFVQPVGDSFLGVDENGVPGIYPALSEAGETMRRGGGCRLRLLCDSPERFSCERHQIGR